MTDGARRYAPGMSDLAADLPKLDGVTHHWVSVDGLQLHVAEAGIEHRGTGPSLVLVHGWPQHWWCWRRVLPQLALSHHVVAIDLRGHGWSETPPPGSDRYDKRRFADDVAGAITELGLDRPVLIGHDWGAWTSLLVAGRHPGLVRGVVATAIVAPWGTIGVLDFWRFGYQLVAGGPWGALVQRLGRQRFLRLVYRLGGAGARPWSDAEAEPYLARYRDPARAKAGRSVYATFLRREVPLVLRGRYQAPVTDVPLLFLPGRGDLVLAPSLVKRGLTAPNQSLEVIDGAGHWVPEEQPDVLLGHVHRFLANLP